MKLSIIVPVYNESEQIKRTFEKFKKLKKKINFKLIFIDDFSTDDTLEKIKKIEKFNKFVKVYKNQKKGLGSSIDIGIKKAKSNYVCIFMCDLSDDVNDLLKYYKIIINNPNLDAVFGTRFSKKSKIKNYPFIKLLFNRIANNLIKIITFSDYNDFTNAFKIYKRKTLLNLMPIVSENFNVFLELPLKLISRKYKYTIIPINWVGRKYGQSKFKMRELGSMYVFTLLYCLIEKFLLNKGNK